MRFQYVGHTPIAIPTGTGSKLVACRDFVEITGGGKLVEHLLNTGELIAAPKDAVAAVVAPEAAPVVEEPVVKAEAPAVSGQDGLADGAQKIETSGLLRKKR